MSCEATLEPACAAQQQHTCSADQLVLGSQESYCQCLLPVLSESLDLCLSDLEGLQQDLICAGRLHPQLLAPLVEMGLVDWSAVGLLSQLPLLGDTAAGALSVSVSAGWGLLPAM